MVNIILHFITELMFKPLLYLDQYLPLESKAQ